ncbi:MurR/RpiR family transcriptional regulator [Streptomyces sp. SID12488]|uniref:SIS domain-containing protein n=1 Tax=Streptomyces sp. SID12488 TaxID=2706040 RepID=UPI0013DAEB3E|nr:MurR/RpiR family transcriptional regulator [Streptomyces sp. SID12488]
MTRDVKEIFGAAAGTAGAARGAGGAGGPAVTPPAPAALAAKVRTLAPTMTRSMQRVAEAVAADPAGCAALTVTGLAELTGTSEATVVRTARLLGYPGYRDLRLALAGLAAQQQSGRSPAVTADIAVDDPIADVVAKLAYDEQQTLADTAAGLDMAQLSAAVAALAAARRIDIYGVGASGLVAQDLTQKLLRIGLIAHAHSDPHLAVTNAVQLRAKDVAVAITHSGSTGDVIEPLRVAFERGATTVAITGRPDGPVTQYADHILTTSTARESELRPAAMSSRTSQLLVVDCLFIGVAQRTYETAAPALSASYEALAHRHTPRSGGTTSRR